MKYIVTHKVGRKRRIAMRNGHISLFKSKKSAKRRAKEYEGYNPRIKKILGG